MQGIMGTVDTTPKGNTMGYDATQAISDDFWENFLHAKFGYFPVEGDKFVEGELVAYRVVPTSAQYSDADREARIFIAHRQPDDLKVTLTVALAYFADDEFAVKTVDGVGYDDTPQSILKLLDYGVSEEMDQWLDVMAERKARRKRLSSIKDGQTVILPTEMTFTNGQTRREFIARRMYGPRRKRRTLTLSDERGRRYSVPGWKEMEGVQVK